MHLRRVAIRNYRSIAKADLKLGEITVIIGPSDSGKSNTIRALRDWAHNTPGAHWVTHGAQVGRIVVVVGTSDKVALEKYAKEGGAAKKARYVTVSADSGEQYSFEKIGQSVPAEVVEITKIGQFEVDDIAIWLNFAQQAEPHFLLASPPWTPGKVSKVIGKISGIDALLIGARDLRLKRTALEREIKGNEAALGERRRKLDELPDLTLAQKIYEKAEVLVDRVESNRSRLETASRLLKEVREAREAVAAEKEFAKRASRVLDRVDSLDLLARMDLAERAESLVTRAEQRRQQVRNLRSQREGHKGALEGCVNLLKGLIREGLVCPLCGEPQHGDCKKALVQVAKGARSRAKED